MSAFPYSFAPLGGPAMELDAYLELRAQEFSTLHRRADWEFEQLPAVLTGANFWIYVPGPVLDVGMGLCTRMVRFCLDFVDRAAERVRKALGVPEPAPRQIMDDINAIAAREADNPGHEVWMYARAMEHPVIDGAVTNAINNRWASPLLVQSAASRGKGQPAAALIGVDDEEDVPEPVAPARRSRGRGR